MTLVVLPPGVRLLMQLEVYLLFMSVRTDLVRTTGVCRGVLEFPERLRRCCMATVNRSIKKGQPQPTPPRTPGRDQPG